MRTMRLHVEGETLYTSAFDPATGTLTRMVKVARGNFQSPYPDSIAWNLSWVQRGQVRSPSPETVDISITDYCPMGCSYCYQDSRADRYHGPKELISQVLDGFTTLPYQMAIGGGEPTLHPDFIEILSMVKDRGVVPNYTTSGLGIKPEVLEATNSLCGGVAMTYHPFKGLDWFVSRYTKLRDALRVQLNTHLIFDNDVVGNLQSLISRKDELGSLNIVLLAYHSDVGRAGTKGLPSKKVYQVDFPSVLSEAQKVGFKFAFSEGLLPYFLSRPELGVNTQFAMRSEGRFSCYIDPSGRMSESSFAPHNLSQKSVWEVSSQKLWDKLDPIDIPDSGACYDCAFRSRCASPQPHHLFLCKKQPLNQD